MSQRKRSLSDSKESSTSSQNNMKNNKKSKQQFTDLANVCVQCDSLATELNSVCCTVCTLRHHTACCGWKCQLKPSDLLVVKELGWVCFVCQEGARSTLDLMRAEHSKLALLVFELQQKLNNLEQSSVGLTSATAAAEAAAAAALSAAQNVTGLTQGTENARRGGTEGIMVQGSRSGTAVTCSVTNRSEVQSIVRRTIRDSDRRKQNVIISGLQESAQRSDEEQLRDLCSSELGLQLNVAHPGTRRLGTSNSNKPRRLLVPVSSEEQARELLSRSKNLRKSTNTYTATNIYINPDLSPEDAKAAFERRQLRRTEATRTQSGHVDPGLAVGLQARGTSFTVWNSSRANRQTSSNNNLIVITDPTLHPSTEEPNAAATKKTSVSNNLVIAHLDPNAMDFQPSLNAADDTDYHPISAPVQNSA